MERAIELLEKEFTKHKLNYPNPKKYLDYSELLEAHKCKEIFLDLIVLATPSGLHANQTIMAANIGINVCTEKPMAVKFEHAKEMVKVCEKNNVKLFVIKQNRLNSTLQDLRKRLRKYVWRYSFG